MKLEGIRAEVRAHIDTRIDRGEVVLVKWVAHKVVSDRSAFEGDDAEFYVVCAYEVVSKLAKEVIGKYTPKAEPDSQLVMSGFEYAQKAYPVERDGDRVLVPTDQLTEDELNERADEYERMGHGCFQHAKELRYLAAHSSAEAVA